MIPPTTSASRIGTATRRMEATTSRAPSCPGAPRCATCASAVMDGLRTLLIRPTCHPGQATQWRRAGMTGGAACPEAGECSCRLRSRHQQADLALHVGAVLDNAGEVALEHDADAVADLEQLVEVGGDDDGRQSVLRTGEDALMGEARVLQIEAVGRLVEDDD